MRLLTAHDSGEVHTIWFNLGWTIYNMLLLGATIATASESRQVRRSHRVPLDVPVSLRLADGRLLQGHTVNFSTGGMAIRLDQPEPIEPGLPVQIGLRHRGVEQPLPATVRHDRDGQISVEFTGMDLEQERWLVACTFARADLWLGQWGQHDRDSFLKSVGQVLAASMRGFRRLGQHTASSLRRGFRPIGHEEGT